MTKSVFTNGDLKATINDALQLDDRGDVVNEAFVAQPKQFNVRTEKLSQVAKDTHVRLYNGYVEKFNETSARLDSADRKAANANMSEFRGLKCAEVHNLNGVYLHELYFANIGMQNSVLHSDTLAYMRLERDFGTLKDWQSDFIACGMSAREGWVVTCLSSYLKRYINVVIDNDVTGIPVGCFPVIVVDMWSHSYFKDYAEEKGKYLRNMMRELDWTVIENRFIRADRIVETLS